MLRGSRGVFINGVADDAATAAPPGGELGRNAAVPDARVGVSCDVGAYDHITDEENTACELNAAVQSYVAACRGDDVTAIPEEFKSKRVFVRLAVRYNKWVSLLCFVSAVAFGINSLKDGNVNSLSDVFLLMQKGGSTGTILKVAMCVFVVSGVLLIALEVVDTVLSVTERRARERQLTQLREHVQSSYQARKNIDEKTADVLERLASSHGGIVSKVKKMETMVLTGAQTYDILQQQHKTLISNMNSLWHSFEAEVERITGVEAKYRDALTANAKLIRTRLESIEEKSAKVFKEHCGLVLDKLERESKNASSRASELKGILRDLKEDIAVLIAKSSETNKLSIKNMLQAHQQWMTTASAMFSVEGAASISMCLFLLRAYSHISDVCESTVKEENVLEQIISRFQSTVRKSDVRIKVAEVSRALQKELAEVIPLQEELETALASGTNIERYWMCRTIVARCDAALFDRKGGMFKSKEAYDNFLQSVYNASADDAISDKTKEHVTFDNMRECLPFLMVMRLMIRIALNVENIHSLADKISSVTGQSDLNLQEVFRGVWISDSRESMLEQPQAASVREDLENNAVLATSQL